MCYSVLKYFYVYATAFSAEGAGESIEKLQMGTAVGNKKSWEA